MRNEERRNPTSVKLVPNSVIYSSCLEDVFSEDGVNSANNSNRNKTARNKTPKLNEIKHNDLYVECNNFRSIK